MSHRRFLTELSRAIPGAVTLERTNAIRAFERDLSKDFGLDTLTTSLAKRVAPQFTTFPLYPDLRAAIQNALGGQSFPNGKSRHPRETEVWLNAFISRFEMAHPDRRPNIVAAFEATAPFEVKQAAREDYPELFKRRDELDEDTSWWWGRIDRLEEMAPPHRLAHAKGMLAILTRYSSDQGPIHDQGVINAVRGIVEELEEQGVLPAETVAGASRGGWKPQTVLQAAPPPKGPSKARPEPSVGSSPKSIVPTPMQMAHALIVATHESGATGKSAQHRLNSLIDHYPGQWAKDELVRMIGAGDFNDVEGIPDQSRIDAVERSWGKQRERLMHYRRNVG